MVAETDQMRRLYRLMTNTLDLVADGKRDPEEVARVLQAVKDDPGFVQRFFADGAGTSHSSEDTASQLESWQKLYREDFGLELDTASLKIPERKPGFNWLIVVAKGITPNRIVEVSRKRFKVSTYSEDLDSVTSVRKTDKVYAIWVKDQVEADEELRNKSVNDLEREGVNSITLEERLLLELWYYRREKKHLDRDNWTLCAGSRRRRGGVPVGGWHAGRGRVGVRWCLSHDRHGSARTRLAVS